MIWIRLLDVWIERTGWILNFVQEERQDLDTACKCVSRKGTVKDHTQVMGLSEKEDGVLSIVAKKGKSASEEGRSKALF